MSNPRATLAAYVYNGWHRCDERDEHFGPGWTEWELLRQARPQFSGHVPPGLPEAGPYDDSDPAVWDARITLARRFGVDVLVPGWFWSRGKTVFADAIRRGFLGSSRRDDIGFAVFWANRMPHRVLPIRTLDTEAPPEYRKVYSDPADFVASWKRAAQICSQRRSRSVNERSDAASFDSRFRQLELSTGIHVRVRSGQVDDARRHECAQSLRAAADRR